MKLPEKHRKPYRLGVALSGGGARGFGHIGAMRALCDFGLVPDIVSGVSAGSVVAAFNGAGLLNDNRLVELFTGASFRDFAEMTVPREALFSMERFKKAIGRILPYKRIEELPVATVICATDLDMGAKEAFTSGPLVECVSASCAMPLVFEPVRIGGRRYVDGGVLANLPAWAIRHQCDKLIGINCSPAAPETTPPKGIFEIARRSFSLMSKTNVTADLEMCDMVINLSDLASHQTFDLHNIPMIVENGYLTAARELRKNLLP